MEGYASWRLWAVNTKARRDNGEVAEILCVLPINFRATERRNRDWSLLEVKWSSCRSHDNLR